MNSRPHQGRWRSLPFIEPQHGPSGIPMGMEVLDSLSVERKGELSRASGEQLSGRTYNRKKVCYSDSKSEVERRAMKLFKYGRHCFARGTGCTKQECWDGARRCDTKLMWLSARLCVPFPLKKWRSFISGINTCISIKK